MEKKVKGKAKRSGIRQIFFGALKYENLYVFM